MRRVKIILPAAITNIGTGLHSVGLAIGLHTTIEIMERSDTILNVETSGEYAGRYALGFRHPVVLGMSRVFQRMEKTVPGLNVRINNQIPPELGLSVETSFVVAGIVAANNLFGNPYTRQESLTIAAQITGRTDQAVTTMLGGLTTSAMTDQGVIYKSLPVAPLKLVLVAPHIDDYGEKIRAAVPDHVPLRDALHNLSRLPLLLEALRTGDLVLAGQMVDDKLFAPYRRVHIPNFDDVVQVAKQNGAAAVTLCGAGPALLALAKRDHAQIASVMVSAFEDKGIKARSWIVPVDTQGVVISAAQTG